MKLRSGGNEVVLCLRLRANVQQEQRAARDWRWTVLAILRDDEDPGRGRERKQEFPRVLKTSSCRRADENPDHGGRDPCCSRLTSNCSRTPRGDSSRLRVSLDVLTQSVASDISQRATLFESELSKRFMLILFNRCEEGDRRR